jgi:hypothetical protein
LTDGTTINILESPQLEQCNRVYAWLEEHKEIPEAPYVFTLLNTPTIFSFEHLKDLENLAIENIKMIPASLPHRCFPITYVTQWLKSEIGNPKKQNTMVLLLNAFWQHILEYSYLDLVENQEVVEGKFFMYDKYFMFLLTHYPIHQDELWWLRSLRATAEYYSRLASDLSQQKTRQKQPKKEQISGVVKKKKQRDCLDQIIDTILRQFALNKESLTDTTWENLKVIFAQYQDQPWATRWISRLDAEVHSLGTTELIDYLATLPNQSPDLFMIRNRFNWWANWVQESGRNFSEESSAVLIGIEPLLKFNTTNLALSTLLSLVGMYLPKTPHSTKIAFGSFVFASLEQTTPEFHNASELVKNYLEYLRGYAPTEEKVLAQERRYLREIAKWYLEQAIKHNEMDFASYGLQILFETLTKFETELDEPDMKLAEHAFLKISSAHLDEEAGGPIARSYFSWLFKQNRPFSIQPYFDFIKTNQERRQAPYFMLHMAKSLDKASIPLSIEGYNSYWQILKFLIRSRLENDGTTLATERFCTYFVKHCSNLECGQEFLRQLSKEAFEVVQEMIDHRRIFFLLPNFLPIWQASVTYPPGREILPLWQTLLGRLQNNHDMEVFGTFTRDLLKHLEVENDATLLEEFYQITLGFIEKNLRHQLSPKLCSTLSTRRASIDKLVDILPTLMHHQAALEDTAYAINRFFRFCSSSLEDSRRIEFERSLIETLGHDLGKPFAEKCLIEILKHCQPKVYHLEISQLFRAYLATGREPERTEDEYEFWKVFKAYHIYEKHSELEQERIRQNLVHYLSVIQNIARKPMAARYLDAVLRTWSSHDIPILAAIDALKSILMEVNPQRWQRIIHLCKQYITLFGESVLLAPNLSIQEVLSLLETNKYQGLILAKQKLQLLT